MTQTEAEQHTPTRWRGWHPAAWIVIVALTAAYAVGSLVLTGLAVWSYQTTCGDAPTPSVIREGRLGIAGLAGMLYLPWLLVAAFIRPRTRIAIAGLLAVSPAVVALVAGVDPEFWRGSWCF
jgi:hypothetical protein